MTTPSHHETDKNSRTQHWATEDFLIIWVAMRDDGWIRERIGITLLETLLQRVPPFKTYNFSYFRVQKIFKNIQEGKDHGPCIFVFLTDITPIAGFQEFDSVLTLPTSRNHFLLRDTSGWNTMLKSLSWQAEASFPCPYFPIFPGSPETRCLPVKLRIVSRWFAPKLPSC